MNHLKLNDQQLWEQEYDSYLPENYSNLDANEAYTPDNSVFYNETWDGDENWPEDGDWEEVPHQDDENPEGGAEGGEVIASGPPEKVSKTKKSYTGKFLNKLSIPYSDPLLD